MVLSYFVGRRIEGKVLSRATRAAVALANGTLFGGGICARIKENLLIEFNLHTLVRLPNGVLAPYTSNPASLPAILDRASKGEL
jgi:type I restriction-modification system DNA methylase subunit